VEVSTGRLYDDNDATGQPTRSPTVTMGEAHPDRLERHRRVKLDDEMTVA
jgi:hypothetical protein